MAEIIQNEGGLPLRGKRRAKRLPAHIDMTPMVDLACLLLTFFILTTAFVKPKVMEIVMPHKGEPKPINKSRVINVILSENDKIFIYNGLADPTEGTLPVMIKTNLSEKGFRKVLLERNKDLFEKIYSFNDSLTRQLGKYNTTISKDKVDTHIKQMKADDKNGPIVLIKAAEGVKYGNLVNVLDEMAITNIARYAVVDINYVERKMLTDALAGKNTIDQD